MADDPRVAYVQARLQSRHGDRPGTEDWRIAETSADLAHYLDAIKRTSLRRWVAGVDPDAAPEAMEREFRAAWRACVDEVSGWSPPPWKPAVSWLKWLPDLPAVEHLLRGNPPPRWMRSDPVLKPLAHEDPERRREALSDSPLAPLFFNETAGDGATVIRAWLDELLTRLPDQDADRAALEGLLDRVFSHRRDMAEATDSGNALRLQLHDQLIRQFRRHSGRMTAAFVHLGIAGLDLERVRAGVMARRLLPDQPEGRSWA
ncbi:MAG: hypothetical protein P8080_06195 [Gammaproteobacteria bacterium]